MRRVCAIGRRIARSNENKGQATANSLKKRRALRWTAKNG